MIHLPAAIWPEERWRRNQYAVTAAVFMVFAGFAFVLPFLPLYIRELGVRDDHAVATWAGVCIGIAPLLAGLLAPVWGRLADRYGHKPMAVRALVSYVVILVLTAGVSNVWQLFALRAGVGLFGGIGPLGLAMVTAASPREHTGRAVGSVQAAQILSAALGPLAGGALAAAIGIRPTFLVTAVACALALVLLVFGYKDPERAPHAPATTTASFGDILTLPGVAVLMLVLFLVNFIGRSFTPILPMHLQSLGVPAASLPLATGALISVYSIAAAISAAVLGRATRRRGPRGLLLATVVAGAVLVLPMALLTRYSVFLAVAILLGLASGGSLTLCYTIGGLMVPSDRRTTAFGFFSGAALFGGALSPSVAGMLTSWQLKGIYYADAALYVLLAVVLLPGVFAERHQRAMTPAPEAPMPAGTP
jgi:DHA1 family multidrug resistance protein-like MFS transporter